MMMKRTKAEIEMERELAKSAAESAALQKTPEYKARQAAELAAMCKAWRSRSRIPVANAAQILGMSKRTYEGIEQGRGFGYPILLVHAIRSFE